MKLRNKKTGKVQTCDFAVISDDFRRDGELCRLESHIFIFRSIKQLNEEYEDYAPAEPLIKDEKIRKAVRAWADANDLFTFKVVNVHFNRSQIIGYDAHNIYGARIGLQSTIAHADKDQFYTIDELCGEDEE